ncbi:hypothetical protein VTO73DRAFT_6431 [Trametes versicolor]
MGVRLYSLEVGWWQH